ncbi:MAG TPA: BTAD domain-containing putative transcriptional regulator [Acidimicrobiales bacterium]|nr:BTAD domain-containing putative transcriptional regulator [Acidimicrobiales bacterium]
MDFRLLGLLEVDDGARPVALKARKMRALLAVLLLHSNQVVSAERLIDALWGESPPPGAVRTLHAYVSKLRKALGHTVVETRPPGYVLVVDPDRVDVHRFERLIADARAATTANEPGRAARLFGEALSLWRGPALADFTFDEFARAEIRHLEEARLVALEDQLDARLALGEHSAVVAPLQMLIEDHPLRERLWGQLMLALYRCGRQAEALRAFGELRRRLDEELGIAVSQPLRRLEEAMLLQKPELDWGPTAVPGLAAAAPELAPAMLLPAFMSGEDCPFVGREAQLERFEEEWEHALSNGPRLLLLSGEPGIGKTRLALEMARRGHRRGANVLMGRCDEDLAVPYQPFAEVFQQLARSWPPEDLRRLLGAQGGELVPISPELGERVPGLGPPVVSDPETQRYRMFQASASVLSNIAQRAPLVLVVDDLHWAAPMTISLLRHVVSRSEPNRLLVLGTYRHTDVPEHHPLVDLRAERTGPTRVTTMALEGLDEGAVERFVDAVVGHQIDGAAAALARSIHSGTAGNALFVREVVRHVAESGQLEAATGGQLVVPPGVRDVVGRRLSRLTHQAHRVLTTAAVMGTEYDLAALRTAVDLDEEAFLSGVEEAVAAGLIVEVPGPVLRQRFTHVLVRSVVYDGLTAARRAQLHRQVGEAIEQIFAGQPAAHLPELAHHFTMAVPLGPVAKALTYCVQAGDEALARFANDEAAHNFRQARALDAMAPIDERRRCRLLMSLGEAERRLGDPAHRQTLFEAADVAAELGDAHLLASAALANTGSFWSSTRSVDAQRVANLEAALAALDADNPLRARLLAKLAVELVYADDAATVRCLSDSALQMARRLGDLTTLAYVLGPRYNTIRGDPATLEERLANTSELVAVAEQLPDPALRCEAWAWRALALMEAGRIDEASTSFATFERLAAGLRQPVMLWYAVYTSVGPTLLAGRLDEAEEGAIRACELGQAAGQSDAERFAQVQRLQIAYERGLLEPWRGPLREAVARDPGSRWRRSWLALAACETERYDEARAAFEDFAANDFADLVYEPAWLSVVTNCALICAHLGDVRRAAILSELARPFADQIVTVVSLVYCGSVQHYLGVLAATMEQFDAADEWYRRAAATHERIGAPAWLARTRLEWGRSLLGWGRADRFADAVAMLEQALSTATSLGLGTVSRRARSELERTTSGVIGGRA